MKGHNRSGEQLSNELKNKISQTLTGKLVGDKNPFYGKHHTEESKQKMSESLKGKQSDERHHNWKGDKVGIIALHDRVRKRLPKPELCDLCKHNPSKQLACITNIYNDDLKNWAWLCIPCHHKWDNIYERVKISRKNKKNYRVGTQRDPKTGRFIKKQ